MALRSEVGIVLHRGVVVFNPVSGMVVAISAFVLYRQRNFGWPIGRLILLSGKIIGYQEWKRPGGLQHEGRK